MTLYLASVALTAFIQLSGFAVAFALQTEVFYDVLGGLNFLALTVYASWAPMDDATPSFTQDPRRILMNVIFACSRAWLLVFLAWRAHERKGDTRFDGVKDKFFKFMLFWMVQGMWVLLISMPMLFVNAAVVNKPTFSLCDWLAIGGFALGVLIEVVADVQKALWVSAGRKGGFCTVGLWSCSRHPNYFGEMFQWWCAWVFAYSSGTGMGDWLWWACSVSPLFTMHVLMNIQETGIAQANGKNLRRYYDNPEIAVAYAQYRENTSILVPMVGYRHVPMCLKRTLFLDLARYEYHPRGIDELVSEPER